MIKQFLLDYGEELLEKKIDLSKEIQKKEMHIKEKIEFINLIEASEDKCYDSFTPQNYKSDSNYQKIKELRNEEKILIQEKEELQIEFNNIEDRILQVQSMIQQINCNNIDFRNLDEQLSETEQLRLNVLETREYERQRIARDLHDSTVQTLAGMIHKIELCNRLIDIDANRCKLELKNLSNIVKDSIRDMREIIYNLRPMSIDDMGLDVSIEQEIDKIRNEYDINIEYHTSGSYEDIIPVVGLAVFRIVQESCNNTIKHASAKNIYIDIKYEADKIIMDISDDGCGFDLDEMMDRRSFTSNGFGLSILYERIYLLSGTIDIKSKINEGTNMHIEIPKKGEE